MSVFLEFFVLKLFKKFEMEKLEQIIFNDVLKKTFLTFTTTKTYLHK